MTITVAFLAECRGSATLDEQRASLDPGDHVVVAGDRGFNKLTDTLADSGVELRAGDRVKLYDLSCINLASTTLVALMSKMLRKGISVEIVSSGIVIEPSVDDKVRVMLEALDAHYRHRHGIKIHRPGRKGRRRILGPDQLPTIREELGKPGGTFTNVARQLGVARATLFNFLERYDEERPAKRRRNSLEAEPERSAEHAAAFAVDPVEPHP